MDGGRYGCVQLLDGFLSITLLGEMSERAYHGSTIPHVPELTNSVGRTVCRSFATR